ncbi:hypothetical protein [Paenirhodobacter populi]|uniref:hypothetical protein n=1 Tax=Paenirhodobacter populi TaxID=2306993 RepID=UPI0013E2D8B4|nr:hypothetical protein [Sinirhodobacter populi]
MSGSYREGSNPAVTGSYEPVLVDPQGGRPSFGRAQPLLVPFAIPLPTSGS